MMNKSISCAPLRSAALVSSLLAALWILAPVKALGQFENNKPTGFRVLMLGGGARAVGLGETLVADGDDPFVTEYNPAGLVATDKFVVAFAHNTFFLDVHGEYLAAALPLGRWALGARMGFIGSGDIPRRTGPSESPLYLYDATDGVFQVALAGPVDDRLSVGISAGWVVEHIDIATANTGILGFGILYKLHRKITIGAAFVNVGPPAQFEEREFKTPNLLRLGGKWSLGDASARAEMVAGDDDNVKWHLGGEYYLDPRLAVRAGVKAGYDTQWFAAGFGARLPDGRFGVDYAFAPYTDDLGTTHRFGLTIRP